MNDDDKARESAAPVTTAPAGAPAAALPGNVLPLHALADKNGVVRINRKAGRPPSVTRRPDTADLEYHAEMSRRKEAFISEDSVVGAIKTQADAPTVLRTIRAEMAKEAAALSFQRTELEKIGRDTTQASHRRIDALTRIANIELEVRRLGVEGVDLRGEKAQKVLKFWIDTVREVAQETLSPETLDLFFNRLFTAMEGWEEKVENSLR